jgi:Fe-S oxidoreductase
VGRYRDGGTSRGGEEVSARNREGATFPAMSADSGQPLIHVEHDALMPLPAPLGAGSDDRPWAPLSDAAKSRYECSLDDTCAVSVPRPAGADEERVLVAQFLAGLDKLFSRENNWTFLQPLVLTMEHCAKCQTCANSCHIFEASGRNELYRPTFRTEILRRLYFKHVRRGGLLSGWQHGEIEVTWPLVARLIELAYRCNLCRRCAQVCPIGADNGLVAHELRKLFSQEMGIAPKEIHQSGSMLQLKAGSSTGMSPEAVKDNIAFIDDEISERTGVEVRTPWDVEGADILVLHNAGEVLSWPENIGAFALILNEAGIRWTLSSELAGYDAVNYGLWYDDTQFARVALKHAEAARRLKVKKIVVGECGHAHKALSVVSDRILAGGLNIPRESSLTLLRDIVTSGRVAFDPSRNDFPVTLHDPCNVVRLMGVVEPQREIVRALCPGFREMHPHGVDNYCCGGGSGFAMMGGHNFADWRRHVAGRKKLQQVLEAFAYCLDPSIPKYLCAPCSNCKGQFRDLLSYHDLWNRNRILYGGLVELVANAMTAVKPGYIEWEWH